jgi:predicted DNA-binding protein
VSEEEREPITSWSPAIRLPPPLFRRLKAMRDELRQQTGRKNASYAEVIERILERVS